MSAGMLALLERSIRVDARSIEQHLLRFLLLISIWGAVSIVALTIPYYGASGLRFLSGIVYLNLAFITLLGTTSFSSAISEEKEQGMLGLLLLSGVSPLGILLAKSGGRLIQVLLLIAVQYPFTLLAVTLGGVRHDQVRALYLGLFAYAVMLTGIGLCCSTFTNKSRSASHLAALAVLVYFLLPLVSEQILQNSLTVSPLWTSPLKVVAASSLFLRIGEILATDFHESSFSIQVVTNLAMGAVGFWLSYGLFHLGLVNLTPEGTTRGRVTRSVRFWRWSSPGRPWKNSLMWKDFYFIAGGLPALVIRTVAYISVYPLCFSCVIPLFGGTPPGMAMEMTVQFICIMTVICLVLETTVLVARSLSQELKSQTFGLLLILPMSAGNVLYSKILGSLLVLTPGILCLLAGVFFFPAGREMIRELVLFPKWTCFALAYAVFIPHVAAARAAWGRQDGVLVALGAALVYHILTMFLVLSLVSPFFSSVLFWMAILGLLALSVYCQRLVRRRVESIAAQ